MPAPDYDQMYQRICALPDTPGSMLQLLQEFPEATVQDWWVAFKSIGFAQLYRNYVGICRIKIPPTWKVP